MLIVTPRLRLLLMLLTSSLLGAGTCFALSAPGLPYGYFWPQILWFSAALAILPGTYLVRLEVLSRRLRSARSLNLAVPRIPKKEGHTYLGEGFVWGPAQARLLLDFTSGGVELPTASRDAIAGDWLLHGIGADRTRPLYVSEGLLNQHIFLMGAPGSGKTRGLELLIEQAVSRGDAVVVIDPKGDEGLLDRTYDSAVRSGREGQFRILALPYPYRSARYNPLGDYVQPSDVADRVAAILPKRGDSEPFRNFAWEFVNIVATALDRLGQEVSLAKLENYCFRNTWLLARLLIRKFCPELPQTQDLTVLLNAYRAHCVQMQKSFPELDALIDMASLNREYYSKISGSLRTILSKLTNRAVGYLLCPGDVAAPPGAAVSDNAPVISWRTIDRERLVVYFYLGSLIGQDTASATARMALADLMSHVGRKYAYDEASGFSKTRLTVIVDEVADALAPESVNLLNKARGAGLSMVMAGQSLADLEVALGGSADARRALANVGSFLTLRAANPEDARFFSDKIGVRPIPMVTHSEMYEPALFSSGRSNIADFAYRASTCTSTRNDPLLPTAALDRLGRGHYFGLWSGELYKGVLPLLDPPANLYSPLLKRAAVPAADEQRVSPPVPSPAPVRRAA